MLGAYLISQRYPCQDSNRLPRTCPPDTATPCAADAAGLSIVDMAVITNPGEMLGGGSIILAIKEGNYSPT